MQTVELTIHGMDCADCARHVEERLAKIPGIGSATVLLAAEKGIVSYDAARTEPEAIIRAIGELGYQAGTATGSTDGAGAMESQRTSRAVSKGQTAVLANAVRFAFVAAVALLALVEMVGERLGLLDQMLGTLPLPLLLLAIVLGGLPIFRSAVLGLRVRQINADLLMIVAIGGATALGEFTSAALIVFFMSVAHWLENMTTNKSRAAIRELVELTPTIAHVLRDGIEVDTPVDQLSTGDLILVRPGDRLSADGRVTAGSSSVDQSLITGESLPVEKRLGDPVFAGSVNQRGALTVQVTRVGKESTLGKIIQLVEEAEAQKAPVQRFADRYAALYLPVLVTVSLLTFLVTRNPTNAIAVLVVACPCAVALATPLAVVAGVGRAARQGILIKGGLYLEALAKVDTLLMDKTGTLTFGRPRVTDIVTDGSLTESQVLQLAATAERYSEHPLATAILDEAAARGIAHVPPTEFQVIPGEGVLAQLDGSCILFGNRRLVETQGVPLEEELARAAADLETRGKTVMFLSNNHRTQGLIAVADVVREHVPRALEQLRRLGIRRFILLTGDNPRVASALAGQLEVEFHAEMLPEDKIKVVRRIQREGHRVAMIGDGINDAPALAQADVGIAMGVAGTDAAIEAAPVALMTDDWDQIPAAVYLARRTFHTIQQNVAFGLLFNLAGLTLASVGILTPVMAAAAQSLPDVAVFLNSSRLLAIRTTDHRP